MSKARMLAIATIGAAVAVPVTITLAGGSNTLEGEVSNQVIAWTTVERTAPADWRPVPETVGDLSPEGAEHTVIVSAQIVTGKAMFRVRNAGGQAQPPGPVTFSKGANSFSWAYNACFLDDPRLEWKRAGARRAVAKRISAVELFAELAAC